MLRVSISLCVVLCTTALAGNEERIKEFVNSERFPGYILENTGYTLFMAEECQEGGLADHKTVEGFKRKAIGYAKKLTGNAFNIERVKGFKTRGRVFMASSPGYNNWVCERINFDSELYRRQFSQYETEAMKVRR